MGFLKSRFAYTIFRFVEKMPENKLLENQVLINKNYSNQLLIILLMSKVDLYLYLEMEQN